MDVGELITEAMSQKPLPERTAGALERAAVALWALYMVEHNAHWNTLGLTRYQEHQLFERLYRTAFDDTDALMERFVGLTGNTMVALVKHADLLSKTLAEAGAVASLHERVLKMERHVEDHLATTRRIAIEDDALSNGLDDLLMSLASNRQVALALLGPKSQEG